VQGVRGRQDERASCCARLNDATKEAKQMRDALLFLLIAGVVVLAIGVDIGMVLAWLRRRWP
jgi:hypothetical protein